MNAYRWGIQGKHNVTARGLRFPSMVEAYGAAILYNKRRSKHRKAITHLKMGQFDSVSLDAYADILLRYYGYGDRTINF